jgi:hypothetical protein
MTNPSDSGNIFDLLLLPYLRRHCMATVCLSMLPAAGDAAAVDELRCCCCCCWRCHRQPWLLVLCGLNLLSLPSTQYYSNFLSHTLKYTQITGEYAAIGEFAFHGECFKCCKCSKELAGAQYVEEKGDFYCEDDYFETFNPKCGHCKLAIKGQYINALDQSWCPDHFVCATCEQPFADGAYLKHEQRPYCKKCYGAATATNCGKCDSLIEGQTFEALGTS